MARADDHRTVRARRRDADRPSTRSTAPVKDLYKSYRAWCEDSGQKPLYFPITFDGETIFEPAHASDDEVLEQYHETIGSGGSGGSKTGRRLFHALASHPVDVLEIGSSDWIVHATEGRYPAEEVFFLGHILKMIEGAVGGEVATDWASARRRELEKGRLLYIAHQVDYLVRKRD